MEQIGVILLLAFLVESSVEYFLGPWLGDKWTRYAALVVGVAVCIVWRVDILAYYVGVYTPIPFAGFIASGFILGRGSNFVHDLAANYWPDATTRARNLILP